MQNISPIFSLSLSSPPLESELFELEPAEITMIMIIATRIIAPSAIPIIRFIFHFGIKDF